MTIDITTHTIQQYYTLHIQHSTHENINKQFTFVE